MFKFPPSLLKIATAIACVFAPVAATSQTISNTARLTYSAADGVRTIASNTVSLTRVTGKRPTTVSFRRFPAGYVANGLSCQTSPLQFTPALVSERELAAAPPLMSFDPKKPMILVLSAPGENRDPTVRDVTRVAVEAAGFMSSVLLTETGVNSGMFAGGTPP
jgi:hypothetical protein